MCEQYFLSRYLEKPSSKLITVTSISTPAYVCSRGATKRHSNCKTTHSKVFSLTSKHVPACEHNLKSFQWVEFRLISFLSLTAHWHLLSKLKSGKRTPLPSPATAHVQYTLDLEPELTETEWDFSRSQLLTARQSSGILSQFRFARARQWSLQAHLTRINTSDSWNERIEESG